MIIFSGLFPKIIFKGNTKYNNDIKVIQIGKTRKLIVNGMVQSSNIDSNYYKDKVWYALAKLVCENKPEIKNILILGMGAGTVIQSMYKDFNMTGFPTTFVEIDDKIAEVAEKYFGLNIIPDKKVVIADASEVLKDPNKFGIAGRFDCIIVDTYQGEEYPDSVNNNQFLINLLNLADGETLLIFNRVYGKYDKENPRKFLTTIGRFLNIVNTITIKGPAIADNLLIFGYKA